MNFQHPFTYGILALISLTSLSAQAEVWKKFRITPETAAEAIIHCAEEAKQLLPSGELGLYPIEAKSNWTLEAQSYEHKIVFRSGSRMGWGGSRVEGKTLTVIEKVTKPLATDMPSDSEWKCILSTPQNGIALR